MIPNENINKYSSLSKKMRELFTPVVHTINGKTWCRARVWSIKAGKLSKNRNKQTSDQEHEKNCIVPQRKEIRAVCVLTPRLFSHPTLMHQSIPAAPSPSLLRADLRTLAFFLPWMANSRGWEFLSWQIPLGGDEKRGQMPRPWSTLQHFSLIEQSSSAF